MTQPTSQPAEFYDGRLSSLLNELTVELHGLEPGTWVQRQTRQGFTVALTVTEDGTRRASISSPTRPARGNEAAWKRFHETVEVMAQHIGLSRWADVAPSLGPQEQYAGAMVEFAEPRVTG